MQGQANENAWRNISNEGARTVKPIVAVRVVNASGEDVATRRRTSAIEVSSSNLSWSWPDEKLMLPMLKNHRRGLHLEFRIVTGDVWHKPIATLQMPCRKAMQAPGRTVREALLWNRKQVLRRRYKRLKKGSPDAPPAVFYAGELTVSVTYHRRPSGGVGGFANEGGSISKTRIMPRKRKNSSEKEPEERDYMEVVIQKVAAHGDDGTNTRSSARVWISTFAIFLYFCFGIIFYVYHESFSFIDALWLCVATITTVGKCFAL